MTVSLTYDFSFFFWWVVGVVGADNGGWLYGQLLLMVKKKV